MSKKYQIKGLTDLGKLKLIEQYNKIGKIEKINLRLMGIKIKPINNEQIDIMFPNKFDKLFDNMTTKQKEDFSKGLLKLLKELEKEGIKKNKDFRIDFI